MDFDISEKINVKNDQTVQKIIDLTKPYTKQKIMGPIYRSSIVKRTNEDRVIYAISENDNIVGYLIWKRYKKEPYFLLEKMAIDSAVRGKGVGSKLLSALIDKAKKEKRNIRLRVAKINEIAIKFYKKYGFNFIKEETHATYTMELILFMEEGKKVEFFDKNALKMPMIITKKKKSVRANTESILKRNKKETKFTRNNNDLSRYGTDYIIRYKNIPLTVKNIFEMSENKKEEVAEFLFDYFRSRYFPFPVYTKEELDKDWEKLCNFDVESIFDKEKKIISSGSTIGNLIFKTYSPHFFFVKEDNKKSRSMVEAFNDDETLMKVIKNRLGITFYYRGVSHPFTMTGNMLRQGFRSMRLVPVTSNFRPTVAKFIYKKFLPNGGSVYDFSSGFNQRLLGAMSCGNIKYIGVDPWETTINNGKKIIEDFGLKNASLIEERSENFNPIENVDLAMSSPPYFSKEVYSNDKKQAYNNGYEYFINEYWFNTVKKIYNCLNDNGIFIFNVCKKHKNYEILDTMKSIAISIGFKHVDTFYMRFSKSHLSKKVGTDNLMKMEPFLILKKKEI